MKYFTIFLLTFLYTTLGNTQSLAKLELREGQFVMDTSYLALSGTINQQKDDFLDQALVMKASVQQLKISKLPNEGFVLSFWMSFEDIHSQQYLLTHKALSGNDTTVFQIGLDSAALFTRCITSKNKTEEQTAPSKDSLTNNHWYYFIYTCRKDQVTIKVLSTNFYYDKTILLQLHNSLNVTIGGNARNKDTNNRFNKLNLYRYATSYSTYAREAYDEMEYPLYKHHRQQAEKPNKKRINKYLRTIDINQPEFTVDIWDYDETDGDILRVRTGDGLSIGYGKKRTGKARNELDFNLKSKKEKQTFNIIIPQDKESSLYFSAIDMGIIDEVNTATIRISTTEQLWDTIHIRPNLKHDIYLKFNYDPDAKSPIKEAPLVKNKKSKIVSNTESRHQLIYVRVTDHSLADGDEVRIQLNKQKAILRKLAKRDNRPIKFYLDQQRDTILVRPNATRLFKCTVKIEVFEKEEGGAERIISSKLLRLKKNKEVAIPIDFRPQQLEQHILHVNDTALIISLRDPHEEDEDKIKVSLDGEILGEYLLVNQTEQIPISLAKHSSRNLNLIATSKGYMKGAANICEVVVKNSKGIILATYQLQMPDTKTHNQIRFIYKKVLKPR